jgi:L,D-peptidoglycan transpeptidase YkuD (ErfK/YbiS/YcfS/YnhG family)
MIHYSTIPSTLHIEGWIMMPDLIVRSLNRKATEGVAEIGRMRFRCGLGRGGRTCSKREGDGATPIGRWAVAAVFYRCDRVRGFYGGFALKDAVALRNRDGWCDAVGDRNYNRPVRHPYPSSAERLWRDDHLYDVIVLLRHNWRPRIQGAGSAIFLHLARELPDGSVAATEGCVSLRRRDLATVLRAMRPGSSVRIVG